MPGFANTHTHLTMTLARGVFEDLSPPHKPPFSGGLSPIPLPDMTPEERTVMAQLGALECLRSGVTFMLEDSNDIDDYAETLGQDRPALPVRRARLRPHRHGDRRSGALPARPRDGRAAHRDHREDLRQMERQGRRPHPHRHLGLGARHVLARAAQGPERAAEEARHLDHHPSQPDLGRGRRGAGASQPAADRVPGRPRLPQRQGDLRPLPLHGPARGEAAGRSEDDRRLQRRDRRAPRPQPAHRIARIARAAPSPWARTTWPRTWSR